MGSTTILRGFKVSVSTLDKFLQTNGVDETYGTPPFYQHHPDSDEISKLLHRKITEAGGTADKNNFRVMIPSQEGSSPSTLAYVTHAWATIYVQREMDLAKDLPEDIPHGFEELRADVRSHKASGQGARGVADEGKMGLYVVYTHEIRGLYTPQEFYDRLKDPQTCDECDAVFGQDDTERHDAWTRRQVHRRGIHGCEEGMNPLPNA